MLNKVDRENGRGTPVCACHPVSTPSEVATHAGEELLHVHSGEVTLTLEGQTYVVRAGDSAHYESTVRHAWSNTSDQETVLLWVGMPCLF